MFVYGKFTNNIVSEVNLTSELGPSMNSALFRYYYKIWIRHILGTQPSSPQSQFEHFSRDTVSLISCRTSYFPPGRFEEYDELNQANEELYELYQDDMKNRMNSSLSSNHPGAK